MLKFLRLSSPLDILQRQPCKVNCRPLLHSRVRTSSRRSLSTLPSFLRLTVYSVTCREGQPVSLPIVHDEHKQPTASLRVPCHFWLPALAGIPVLLLQQDWPCHIVLTSTISSKTSFRNNISIYAVFSRGCLGPNPLTGYPSRCREFLAARSC